MGVGLGDQGGCERRIEVFGKIQKKKMGRGGVRWGGRVGVGDVNAMLGVGVMWGMGDVWDCTILKKLKTCGGEGQYLNPKHSL